MTPSMDVRESQTDVQESRTDVRGGWLDGRVLDRCSGMHVFLSRVSLHLLLFGPDGPEGISALILCHAECLEFDFGCSGSGIMMFWRSHS